MQRMTIKTIMHGTGIALAVVCLVLAGLAIGVGHFSLGWEGALQHGLQTLVMAPFVYVAFRFGGWVTAELAGKPDSK